MSKNHENSNVDMVHVDAYTRDDGTQVSEYWRRKSATGRDIFQLSISKDVQLPDLRNPLYDGYNYNPDNINLGDIFQEKLYVNFLGRKSDNQKSPTAFLNNAINDFKDARNDKNATVYDSGNSIPDAGLRKFITEDKNITDNGRIDVKNMRGAYYNAKSDIADSVAHDSAMKQYVKDNYANLVYNGKKIEEYQQKVPDEVQPWFSSTYTAKANINLLDNANKWDIAHCTLYNPHITSDGHFKTQVIDIVDYENQDYPEFNISHPLEASVKLGTNLANQWGYKMQQIGRLENVFHIVDIDIPVNEIDNK